MKFIKFSPWVLSIFFASNSFAFTSWQGPYLGAYGGAGFAYHSYSANAGSVTTTSYFSSANDISAVQQAASPNEYPSSAVFGITAGHDFTWQQIVYGVVFDYGALPLSSSHTVNATLPSNGAAYNLYTAMSTNWLMTFRGRLGYPTTLFARPSLIYATGGLAITQVKINNHYTDTSSLNGVGNSHSSENLIGWTAGAGIEMLTLPNTTFDFEYLYTQLPAANTTANISNSAAGFGIPANSLTSALASKGCLETNVFRVGINYRFDE
jgi:outer membrane immunogenic protein